MKETHPFRSARLGWLLLLLPAWLLLNAVTATVRYHAPAPFGDQWVDIYWWRELSNGSPLLPYLFRQHNEHRICIPRLFFIADWKLFHASDTLNLTSIWVVQIIGAAFFIVIADLRRGGFARILSASFATSLMFSLFQWENFFNGFQLQFVGVFVASAWFFYTFFVKGQAYPPNAFSLSAPIVLLAVATFTMANGLFAGIAAFIVCIISRAPIKRTFLLTICVAVLGLIYLHGYRPVAGHSPAILSARQPMRFASYVLAYIGNPWADRKLWLAEVVGGTGVLLTAAMAWRIWLERGSDTRRQALFSVVLLVGITASATALGRLSFGVDQAMASRYMTPALWFWGAQAVFWATFSESAKSRLLAMVISLAIALPFLLIAPLQKSFEQQLAWTHDQLVPGRDALLAGVIDKPSLTWLYPDLPMLNELRIFLKSNNLSIFHNQPDPQQGARMDRRVIGLTQEGCFGSFDILLASPGAGVASATGWGWDNAAHQAFSRVVLTDDTGRIIGSGSTELDRPDVRKVVREVHSDHVGWRVSVASWAPEVRAWGLMQSGSACELGRKPWPQ